MLLFLLVYSLWFCIYSRQSYYKGCLQIVVRVYFSYTQDWEYVK